MSSPLLLQQCPVCLVRLTRMVWVICGRWPYSCFLVGCCFYVLFRITRSMLVLLPSSLFSSRFVRVEVVQPYSSTDTTTTWKNCLFNLSVRLDFHMIDNLFIAVHAFPIRALTSFSVDGHLPHITQTIRVRRTRHVGHCWRSKDELISDVLLWKPAYGHAGVGRPAKTYIDQLCADT